MVGIKEDRFFWFYWIVVFVVWVVGIWEILDTILWFHQFVLPYFQISKIQNSILKAG